MIKGNYTLFTRIPLFINENNELYTDKLWEKDLSLHFEYIDNFRICCPIVQLKESANINSLEFIKGLKIENVYQLKKDYGHISVALNLIPNFFTVAIAAYRSDIVHSGGAGWAFPLSFYLLVCSIFIQFKWVVVIESSFWALSPNTKFNLRLFLRHHIYMWFLKRCVRAADARIFTHKGYKDMFLHSDDRTFIAPATWIDEENIQPEKAIKESRLIVEKRNPRLKVIFPTRLIKDKGVFVVLAAVKKLQESEVGMDLTIIGAGPLSEHCREFAAQKHGSVSVTFVDPVDYGEPFFSILRKHHILLIANMKDEQPRIIFDAFSQGVGIVAANTDGIREMVADSSAASLFNRGDSSSLAAKLMDLADNQSLITGMGISGLKFVSGKTHKKMHLDREDFLHKTLK